MKKSILALVPVMLLGAALSACGGGDNSNSGESSQQGESQGSQTGSSVLPGGGTITIDGGGDICNFNSSDTYHTLQDLCDEWAALHPGFEVKVNKSSNGGDRSVLLPLLKTKKSADIVYQNATVINSDLGQDFYLDLTDYLNSPNPYLEDNALWKTVYDEGELATTLAADGHNYFVNMEKIPVAFLYNKDLLAEAGVTNPETIGTFNELLAALDKVQTKFGSDPTYAAYTTTYTWYQIAMESNLFSDMIPQGDVLRKNNMIDNEELCRLYTKGIFQPQAGVNNDYSAYDGTTENRYYDYIKLINQLDQYKAPATYSAVQGFVAGKVAFIEATGQLMASVASNSEVNFNWGAISFPDLTTDNSKYATKGVVRGSAGLATSYWVTNHAIENGNAEACADLLMFLTAPQNNNRMIGDLKYGIPLNPTDDYELAEYLKPLVAQYNEDIKDAAAGNRVYWASFNSWAVLGTNYYNSFIRTMQEVDAGTTTPEKALLTLSKSIKNTVMSYIAEYDYDVDSW